MTTYYNSENDGFVKPAPVVKQLNAIFRSISDETLIAALKAPKFQGPTQYLTFLGALIKARSISVMMVHMPPTMKAR